jgi:hypothetical protein
MPAKLQVVDVISSINMQRFAAKSQVLQPIYIFNTTHRQVDNCILYIITHIAFDAHTKYS